MTSRKLGAVASAAAAMIFATTAVAQTPAASLTHGPALPGVCVLDAQQAIATSTVGKYVDSRMTQLIQQVSTELKPENDTINTEAKTLESTRATMDKAQWEKRATDLSTRGAAFERKANQRQAELERTRSKAIQRVAQEMDPVIVQVYQQRKCSLLLDGRSVMASNPAMDITSSVIAGLNAKIQQFAFEREHLDAQAAAAAQ
ncbi:MAG TPA: OmpH family outer membrane protein [Caulobacteraceae bacterium]